MNITNNLTPEGYIFYTIFLKQTIRDTGFMKSDESSIQEQVFTPTTNIKPIMGTTTNRLDEVRTYNKATPYVPNVNGVTEVTKEEVSYLIDGIIFTTNLETLVTKFAFGVAGLTNANSASYPVVKDERDNYTTKTATQNNIFIQRNEISVYSGIYKLSRVDSIDDFKLYF